MIYHQAMLKCMRPLLIVMLALAPLPSHSQQDSAPGTPTDSGPIPALSQRVQIAEASGDYPVTPGDQYVLVYQQSLERVSLDVSVQSDGTLNLAVFGDIDTSGMTLPELRETVQKLVDNAYQNSFPQFRLANPAVFEVKLEGAIPESKHATVWAFTRLSQLYSDAKAPYTSLRRVRITDRLGRTRLYDLFRAMHLGDSSQDPRIEIGDTVEFLPRGRSVTVSGEVVRPGTYELRRREDLSDLIETMAGGFTSAADTGRIQLERGPQEGTADRLSYRRSRNTDLDDLDRIRVPSLEDRLPVVYLEGALSITENDLRSAQDVDDQETNDNGKSDQRVADRELQNNQPRRRHLREGESLFDVLEENKNVLREKGDLRNGFIRREGRPEPIQIDMEELLFKNRLESDIELKPNDRIVVPFGNFEVFVTGEVTNSSYANVASLTRLSTVIDDYLTDYSSIRDITVRAVSGQEQEYDLFRARRYGERNQDPYLQPGDTVVLSRTERRVTVEGLVERPGEYQLLPGEGIQELVEVYGGGLAPNADPERATVLRPRAEEDQLAQTFDVDLTSDDVDDIRLADLDRLSVPSVLDRLPVIYLDGALSIREGVEQEPEGEQEGETVSREELRNNQPRRRPLRDGETLLDVLEENRELLSDFGDLRNGFIRRRGTPRPIRVDMEALLFQNELDRDVELEPNDRIVIPFGVIEVFVTGEVTNSSYANVASLTRLSTVIDDYLTDYSSIRDIKVRSVDGQERSFDLFSARRYGDREQDPYLQSGDTVIVSRRQRGVSLQGAAVRPGEYQLLPGENLVELIEVYGQGFDERANPGDIEIVSYLQDANRPAELQTISADWESIPDRDLRDGDEVRIGTMSELLPAVFFEGALRTGTGDEIADTGGAVSDRFRYQYTPGETLRQATRRIRDRFLTTADLQNAFVERASTGERIPVDIRQYLYSNDLQAGPDIPLERNDMIILPFRQYFVSVSGGVNSPGRYPYIPDRGFGYYLGLAGGADPSQHIGNNPVISDVDGNRKRDSATIAPEDTIHFRANNPSYYLNFLTPVLTVVSSIFSTWALLSSLGAF